MEDGLMFKKLNAEERLRLFHVDNDLTHAIPRREATESIGDISNIEDLQREFHYLFLSVQLQDIAEKARPNLVVCTIGRAE